MNEDHKSTDPAPRAIKPGSIINSKPDCRDISIHEICMKAAYKQADRAKTLEEISVKLVAEHSPLRIEQVETLLNRYIAAESDWRIREELEFERFCIEQDSIKAEYQRMHDETFGALSKASPVNVKNINAATYLQRLFSPGECVLLIPESSHYYNAVWRVPEKKTKLVRALSGYAWFWPLPVSRDYAPDVPRPDNYPRSPLEAVTSWKYAIVAIFGDGTSRLFSEIVERKWNVVSVSSFQETYAQVMFRIDGQTEKDWREKCKALRAQLRQIGSIPSAFRIDRRAHIPGKNANYRIEFLT